MVMVDPTQIHQILMNLCTNAAHAMQERGGCLSIELNTIELNSGIVSEKNSLESGTYVQLCVSDTGHGMPSKVIDRIFDPYFTTKERGEGTGMGLSVVHGIVESYNGAYRFKASQEKDRPSRFYFRLLKGVLNRKG